MKDDLLQFVTNCLLVNQISHAPSPWCHDLHLCHLFGGEIKDGTVSGHLLVTVAVVLLLLCNFMHAGIFVLKQKKSGRTFMRTGRVSG